MHAILVAGAMLSACQMTSAQIAKSAILTNPGAEVRLELSEAIGAMTGFTSVALADQDFTQNSELVIERKHQRAATGELIQGRDLDPPHRFQLALQNGQCWLIHQTNSQRVLLKNCPRRRPRPMWVETRSYSYT